MLKKSPNRLFNPTEPINSDELCDYANILDSARTLGANQQPAKTESTLSPAEREVVEVIDNRILHREQELERDAMEIEQKICNLPKFSHDRNQKFLGQHVTNLVMKAFQDRTPTIRSIVSLAKNTEAENNAYRDTTGIGSRTANYPASILLSIAKLVAIACAEASLNMVLFKDVTGMGLLGGFITALAISAGNISVAVFLGLVPLRYLNKKAKAIRLWAYPALTLAVSFIAFLNLYAAHFREVGSQNEEFSNDNILEHLITSPAHLSLQSYILLVLGLLCAVYAGFKGYQLSDPYPGFEAQDRRLKEAREDFDYLVASIHGDIEAVRETEIVIAADAPHHGDAALSQISDAYAQFKRRKALFSNLNSRDLKAARQAIDLFRKTNLSIRTDGLEPEYFKQSVQFADLSAFAGDAHSSLDQAVQQAHHDQDEYRQANYALITEMLSRIERAKDNTAKIMTAIEASFVDDKAVPELSEIRALIEPKTSTTANTNERGDKS